MLHYSPDHTPLPITIIDAFRKELAENMVSFTYSEYSEITFLLFNYLTRGKIQIKNKLGPMSCLKKLLY